MILLLYGMIFDTYAQTNSSVPSMLFVDRITTDNGISSNQVQKVWQDKTGFLWLVTDRGLTKFNGYDCVLYQNQLRNPNSLSANELYALLDDGENLWIGAKDGLNRFDTQHRTFKRFFHDPQNPNSLSDSFIAALLKDRKGNLWIATNRRGLNLFDPIRETFRHFRHNPNDPNSLTTDRLNCLAEAPDGKIWIGALDHKGLMQFDPITAKVKPFNIIQPEGTQPDVTSLLVEPSGVVWLGSWNMGLFRIDPSDGSFRNYRHDPKNPNSLTSDIVQCIYSDEMGKLWLGTRGGGLCILDLQTERFSPVKMVWKTEPNKVIDTILDICRDSAGNLWFGTLYEGVCFYNPKQGQFQYFKNNPKDPNSLSENRVYALHGDPDGVIWIGTDGGGLNCFNPKTELFSQYIHDASNPNSLDSNTVTALCVDRRGNLWVGCWGTDKSPFNRFIRETQGFHKYPHQPNRSEGFHGTVVRTIREDYTGKIWIGTEGEGLNVFDPNTETFRHYDKGTPTQKGLQDDFIRCIYEDHAHTLWVGVNNGGLHRYDRTQDRFLIYSDGKPSSDIMNRTSILTIYEDHENALWLGTDRGLDRINPERTEITHFTVDDEISDVMVKSILEDASGYLWIGLDNGKMSRLDPKTRQFLTFDRSDGVQGLGFTANCCTKGSDGELYFGGLNGLNKIRPQIINRNPYIPPIVITALEIMGKPFLFEPYFSTGRPIILPYQQNFLSFEFVALNYTQSHKNQYAYRLIPLETNWNYTTNQRRARYTALPPGRYTFQVKGSNNDGLWNEVGTSLSIHITPPFWATLQCRILFLSLIVFLLISGHYWRVRRIEIQRRKLEIEVKRAVEEIKTLQGIVPICSYCKKIRDDQGYWEQVEIYISEHSKAEFTHGICPECMAKHFPEYQKIDTFSN